MSLSTDGSPFVAIDPVGIGVLARQVAEAQRELEAAAAGLRSALAVLGLLPGDAITVGEIASWLGAQVAGLQRRQSLAETAGRAQPWNTGLGPLITIDETLALRFPTPADATAAGKAAAVNLRAALAAGNIDPIAVEELRRYGRDARYAVAFATEMGPAGLTAVAAQLRKLSTSLPWTPAYMRDPEHSQADLQARSLAMMKALSETFAAATRGDGDMALPVNFADELVAGLPANAFGLSQLLRFGQFDATFLGRVSEGVHAFDTENAGLDYWRAEASKQFGSPLPSFDDTGQGYWDPMVGVMTALGRNPIAAQNFFSQYQRVEDMAARDWTADDGEALGNGLVAATTFFRDNHSADSTSGPSRGYTSALIASAALHHFGTVGAELPKNMRDSIGAILAAYFNNVALALKGGDGEAPVGVSTDLPAGIVVGQPFGASIRKADVLALLAALRPDELAPVQAAANAYRQLTHDMDLGFITAQGPQPVPPPGSNPVTVADWWDSATEVARATIISQHPEALGNLDGLPPSLRNTMNRAALKKGIADTERDVKALEAKIMRTHSRGYNPETEQLRALQERLAFFTKTQEGLKQADGTRDVLNYKPIPVQLLIVDPPVAPAHGRAALVFGDLATADNVTYVIPGLKQWVNPEFHRTVGNAAALHTASQARNTGKSLATVAWIGYETPGFDDVVSQDLADAGAERLAQELRGLRAIRRLNDPHLTVVAHSYGSAAAGIAARKYDDLQIDDLALVGSAGAGTSDVTTLHVPRDHVWVGSSSHDIVTRIGRFGGDPASHDFGTRFQAEAPQRHMVWNDGEHSQYFAPTSESLMNLSRIVTRQPERVVEAPDRTRPKFDPGAFGNYDPEADREVVEQGTDTIDPPS